MNKPPPGLASYSLHVALPPGVMAGRVIGKGGSTVKSLAFEYDVRLYVDVDAREVIVTGQQGRVEEVEVQLQRMFNRIQTRYPIFRAGQQQQRKVQKSGQNDKKSGQTTTVATINLIAAAGEPNSDTWRFALVERDCESVKDPNVRDFTFRLVRTTQDDEEKEENKKIDKNETIPANNQVENQVPLLHVFDARFQQRMLQEAASFRVSPDGSKIKLNAVLGIMCFELPNPAIALKPLAWEKLQTLKLFRDVTPRWANCCISKSPAVADLMRKLQAQITHETEFKTVLTVYLSQLDSSNKRSDDMAIKYHLEGTKYKEWVPVKSYPEKNPVRNVHALYNVAVDNGTAFRIRASSRAAAPSSMKDRDALEHGLNISTPPGGNHFHTRVSRDYCFPRNSEIRAYFVKERAYIDMDGLRFKFSYMNSSHTDFMVECRLLPADADADMPLPDKIAMFLEKIQWVLQCKQ